MVQYYWKMGWLVVYGQGSSISGLQIFFFLLYLTKDENGKSDRRRPRNSHDLQCLRDVGTWASGGCAMFWGRQTERQLSLTPWEGGRAGAPQMGTQTLPPEGCGPHCQFPENGSTSDNDLFYSRSASVINICTCVYIYINLCICIYKYSYINI